MAEEKKVGKKTGWAVVAYIIFFLPLLVNDVRDDKFVKFHVKQGLVLFIVGVVIKIIWMLIPVIGPLVIFPIGSILMLVLFIIGIMNALNGEEKELPVIGSLAKSFNF